MVAVAAVAESVTEGQEVVAGPAVVVVLQWPEAGAAAWRGAAAGWR